MNNDEVLKRFSWDKDIKLWKGDKWGLKYCREHNKDLKEAIQLIKEKYEEKDKTIFREITNIKTRKEKELINSLKQKEADELEFLKVIKRKLEFGDDRVLKMIEKKIAEIENPGSNLENREAGK